MKQYEKKIDEAGRPYLETSLPGLVLTRLPLLNKATGFTAEEREAFGLDGLLPTHVSSLEEQTARNYANYGRLADDFARHVFLRALQDRSEVLFYALLEAHIEEMMPIIYTPTVAWAVRHFSRLYRYPRGLVVNTENIHRIDALLESTPFPDVQLIVATDNEGVLGIGDQGFGGLAICIGKLSLYTAAAGIDPAVTLPVELDVGTNRKDLLDDPIYLGVRHERLTGKAYEDFIHTFVTALKRRFPNVLLQWEDFSKQKAFTVLDRYRDELPSLNDDIQGTGAVVLSGLLAAQRSGKAQLAEQTFVIHGAGAGGVGVGRQIVRGLMLEGLSERAARERIFLIDSKGLILSDRKGLEPYKLELAQPPGRIAGWKTSGDIPTLLETVREAEVTALLGLSGQKGAFTEEVVRQAAKNAPHPLVFALSNPTDNCEAIPEAVYRWTDGRALVATGSPFEDVSWNGERHPVGQGNNAFIFPGLGLGVLLARARRISDDMLTQAALALAEFIRPDRLKRGALYPSMDRIVSASRQVAMAVIRQAKAEGLATVEVPEDLENWVASQVWRPEFLPIRKAR